MHMDIHIHARTSMRSHTQCRVGTIALVHYCTIALLITVSTLLVSPHTQESIRAEVVEAGLEKEKMQILHEYALITLITLTLPPPTLP